MANNNDNPIKGLHWATADLAAAMGPGQLTALQRSVQEAREELEAGMGCQCQDVTYAPVWDAALGCYADSWLCTRCGQTFAPTWTNPLAAPTH